MTRLGPVCGSLAAALTLGACLEYQVGDTTIPVDPVGPHLEIDPMDHVFDDVCTPGEVELTLANTGDEVLEITRLRLVATDSALRLSHHLPVPDPVPVEAGESVRVTVTYTPNLPVPIEGTLTVQSTDPAGPVEATQRVLVDTLQRGEPLVGRNPPVDVLFALDTTGSMGALHEDGIIRDAMGQFFAELETQTLDWKAGSVWGWDACSRASVVRDAVPDPVAVFAAGLPGSQAPANHNLLYLIDEALVETQPGGCNQGFRRPGAALLVVLISNSMPETDRVWTEIAPAWLAQVPDCRLLTVVSVIDNVSYPGIRTPNPYIDAAEATFGGVVNARNDGPPWDEKMASAGAAAAQKLSVRPLAAVPVDGTLEVQVGGLIWKTGWEYVGELTGVRLIDPLGPTNDVAVRYEVDSCNPAGC